MPTDEERREVAAKLRSMTNYEYSSMFIDEIIGACIGGDLYDDEYQLLDCKIVNRLADLIEPEPERTCRMEIDWDYDGGCPAYYRDYVCSECKEDFIYYKHSRINYCPNCGAKVVE